MYLLRACCGPSGSWSLGPTLELGPHANRGTMRRAEPRHALSQCTDCIGGGAPNMGAIGARR
eukprot:6001379-Prymnesium_polylepis.2